MADQYEKAQGSIPVSKGEKRWVYIGAPFDTGRMVDAGKEIPIAFCEHRFAAPMKQYTFTITEKGMNLIKRLLGR